MVDREKMSREETITVAVRIRPLLQTELDQGLIPTLMVVNRQELRDQQGRNYVYDRVFDPDVTTSEVFETIGEEVVLSTLDGYSGCVFCYGHTGSGKTFTMHGNRVKNPGLVPLAVETIFSYIEEAKEKEFLIRCSYLEIYNESINDLLNSAATNLSLREDPLHSISIENLTETVCTSVEQIYSLLNLGDSNKQFAATQMNARSSRSHTILRITVESKTKRGREVCMATLNMVDLAGSESALAHIASAGTRQREMKCINRSLLTLSTVIQRLSEERKQHIPYRDSKLTRLLKPALEGKAKVCVICNVSPNPTFTDETINTLKFAQRAKKVTQTISKTEVVNSDVLLLQYEEEIKRLQVKIVEMESRIETAPEREKITEELEKLGRQLHKKDTEVESLTEEKVALQEQLERYKRFILDSETVKQTRDAPPMTDIIWDSQRHGRQSIRMRELLRPSIDPQEPSLLTDLDCLPEVLNSDNPIGRLSNPFGMQGRESYDLSQLLKEKDERIVALEVDLQAKSSELDELKDALAMCRGTIQRLLAENKALKQR